MKLTKENIYIDLRGKSKEKLTELWEFLNNAGEKQFRDSLNDFLNNCKGWLAYEFHRNKWTLSSDRISLHEKTEVTIEQLKQILQPMENTEEFLRKEAIKRGFVNGVKFYGSEGAEYDEPMLINDNIKYMKPEEEYDNWGLYVKNSWLCFNGKWGTLIKESLEQQLQKAEAEVKRLQSLIEEENKPKVGDWAMLWEDDEETPVFGLITDVTDFYLTCNGSWEYAKKITNKQLIELLENESRIIKE